MEAFVIKSKDGSYLFTYYVYEDENFGFGELNEAKLFDNIDYAKEYLRQLGFYYDKSYYEIVEVEIKEKTNESVCR